MTVLNNLHPLFFVQNQEASSEACASTSMADFSFEAVDEPDEVYEPAAVPESFSTEAVHLDEEDLHFFEQDGK